MTYTNFEVNPVSHQEHCNLFRVSNSSWLNASCTDYIESDGGFIRNKHNVICEPISEKIAYANLQLVGAPNKVGTLWTGLSPKGNHHHSNHPFKGHRHHHNKKQGHHKQRHFHNHHRHPGHKDFNHHLHPSQLRTHQHKYDHIQPPQNNKPVKQGDKTTVHDSGRLSNAYHRRQDNLLGRHDVVFNTNYNKGPAHI